MERLMLPAVIAAIDATLWISFERKLENDRIANSS